MSWDWYIDNRIDLTDDEIAEYFRYKYRGGYYVEMKRQICKILRAKGYTTSHIGTMLYGSPDRHDAVIHHMKSKPFHKATEVQINWRSWIKDKVYPISSEQSKYDDNTGAYYRMEYSLKHVSELIK
jgi:arylamine N-acetyltransferase